MSGLVDDLDKPAYFLLVSTLLLDVARSHPLQDAEECAGLPPVSVVYRTWVFTLKRG